MLGIVLMLVVNVDLLFLNLLMFVFNDIVGLFGLFSWFDIGMLYFYGKMIYFGMDKIVSGGV